MPSKILLRRLFAAAWAGLLAGASSAIAQQPAGRASEPLAEQTSKYYTIYSDLGQQAMVEAALRLDAMAEEYHARTKGFAGNLSRRMPFYLFSSNREYFQYGGVPGTAGVFNGQQLMAVAGAKTTDYTWQVVQHEGFHQFAAFAIGGDIPIWANEGLAEYFGEAVFTGDTYVAGLVPPRRLAEVKGKIEAHRFKPLSHMLALTHAQWNRELDETNYDLAWSMVHFLAHAQEGRYQAPFNAFMNAVSRGAEPQQAWANIFGRGTKDFEDQWRGWWLSQPEDPTAALYAEAAARTIANFLGRAYAQRQTFTTLQDFLKAAKQGQLKMHRQDWLPPSLLDRAVRDIADRGRWELASRPGSRLPVVRARLEDGTVVTARFRLRGSRVGTVTVERENGGQ